MKKVHIYLFVFLSAILFCGCTLMRQPVRGGMGYSATPYTTPTPPALNTGSIRWMGILKSRYWEIKIDPGYLIKYAFPALTGETAENSALPLSPCVVGQIRF